MTSTPKQPMAWDAPTPSQDDFSADIDSMGDDIAVIDDEDMPPFDVGLAQIEDDDDGIKINSVDIDLSELDAELDMDGPAAPPPAFAFEESPPPPMIEEPLANSAPASALVEGPQTGGYYAPPEARAADGALIGDFMLPRISIHAFVENASTAQMLQTAASDRRLAKAAFNVTMGGVPAAVLHLGAGQAVNLIVVESVAPAAKLLADLDHLAEFCDAQSKVIVIGQQNDIGLYRELIRRGVSEYLVPPMHPLNFIRAAANLYADASQPFIGRSMAFIGAKGGVGASTICHNIAWSLSSRIEVNTTLVDLDLSFGTSGLDFNQDAAQGVADALASPDRVDDVVLDRLLTRCSERLTLFSAPATIDRNFEFAPAAYQTVIERVRRSVPYVVLDLPHLWQPWVRQTLSDADDVIIVCTPDLPCLRNAKNMVDSLKAARRNDAPPKVVLNMVGVPKRPEIPVKDFGEALGVAPMLVLPFDPMVFAQAANNGQMLAEVAPQSKTAEGIDFMAGTLAGRAPAPKKSGLLSKLAIAKR